MLSAVSTCVSHFALFPSQAGCVHQQLLTNRGEPGDIRGVARMKILVVGFEEPTEMVTCPKWNVCK